MKAMKKMKEILRVRKICALLVVACCFLGAAAVFAERAFAAEKGTEKGERLFLLSPTYSWYFPTAGKTKNAFGSSWSGLGVAVNLEALGWGVFDWEIAGLTLHPYFGYIHGDKGDNDVHIIPIGLEARWNLGQWSMVAPYVGMGVSVYGVRLEDRDAGVDTGWRGAFGGRLTFGADITRWFNVQAAYNLMSDVEGYDLSGFSLQGKLKIYF
jgi:hypothetical protein